MAMNRRQFLGTAALGGGGLLLARGAPPASAAASALPPRAVGILYDATLCIGCKSCMVNCKKHNTPSPGALALPGRVTPPYESGEEGIWDDPRDLSSRTLSVIKVYRSGSGVNKDAVTDGYSFVKQHCLHCLTPACVSVCPVGALHKDAETGVVWYEESRCIGCRYCQIACPFRIPRYEYESTSPQVRKCQLCRHRMAAGGYAACCEFCPTGASIFGPVAELREEARRRLELAPGSDYDFPIQTVQGPGRQRRPVSRYERSVYGLSEAGGTQYLLLAGVPFDLLGFDPGVSDASLPDITWGYIAKIPYLIVGILAAGAATWAVTSRHETGKEG